MGIQEALLPASHQEAKELVKVILDRQAASSEAGIALTEALLAFTKSNIPFHKLENTSQYLIRFLIGDAYSEMLKVLPPEGCISILIPEAVKGVFKIGERLEHKVKEPMQFFMDEFSKIAAKKMVEYFDDYKKRNFVIPEEFMKAWF